MNSQVEQKYISPAELSRITSISKSTLERMRTSGTGPPFSRVRRRVLYRLDAALTWLESHASSSDTGGSSR